MIQIKQNDHERALLVGVRFSPHFNKSLNGNGNGITTEESLLELAELANTAGAQVVKQSISKRDKPNAGLFIGKGKVEQYAELVETQGIKLVVFDDDLSPTQQKQLQEAFNVKVIDRTGLILDIFAQRAHSREGKLEVELAQMTYLLPRLTRMWSHLSRQDGGIGTRGPGETQLEVDRRRVRERISRLKTELEDSKQNRETQRKKRQKIPLPTVAIVGYTNAGKSTLLNSLTAANVLVDDKLFATLDPTSRKVELPNNQMVVFTDTVGFIRKLPHHLVESFKATLEEVVGADILVHVLDAAHPQAEEHYEAVRKELEALGCHEKPTVLALNKVDKLEDKFSLHWWETEVDHTVQISAKKRLGFESLLQNVEHLMGNKRLRITLNIPLSRGDVISLIYKLGQVDKTHYNENSVRITAEIPQFLESRLNEFLVKA